MNFFDRLNIILSFLGISTGFICKKIYQWIKDTIKNQKQKEEFFKKFVQSTNRKNEKQDEQIKNIQDHTQQTSEAQSDIIRRQRVILYNQIRVKSKNLINHGYVTLSDLDALNLLYKEYKDLGGNGTAKILYEQAIKLPKRSDKEDVQ